MTIIYKKSFKEPLYDITLLLTRLLLAIVFIVSGVAKLLDIHGFAQVVNRFMLLPESIVLYFAFLLPIVELFLGLCLTSGLYIKWTIRWLSFLLFCFIFVISISLIRGISVKCGCFGGLFDDVIGWKTLTRNIFLLGLLIFLGTRKSLKFVIQ